MINILELIGIITFAAEADKLETGSRFWKFIEIISQNSKPFLETVTSSLQGICSWHGHQWSWQATVMQMASSQIQV